jgi:hypothetical protein
MGLLALGEVFGSEYVAGPCTFLFCAVRFA